MRRRAIRGVEGTVIGLGAVTVLQSDDRVDLAVVVDARAEIVMSTEPRDQEPTVATSWTRKILTIVMKENPCAQEDETAETEMTAIAVEIGMIDDVDLVEIEIEKNAPSTVPDRDLVNIDDEVIAAEVQNGRTVRSLAKPVLQQTDP